MFTYKNVSGEVQELIGHGLVKVEAIIESKVEINNPNFELQKLEKTEKPKKDTK